MSKIYFYILVISSLLFSKVSFAVMAGTGTDEFNSLNIVYVDDAKTETQDELSGPALFRMQNLMDSIKANENTRFLLYISNGEQPMVESKDYSKAFDLISVLYNEPTKVAPNCENDLDKMQELLFKEKYTVKDNINIHLFLTDHYFDTLMEHGIQKMTNYFAREVAYNTSFQGKSIDVFIYYTSQSKKFRPKDIEKKFQFYSSLGLSPAVNVHYRLLK